MYQSTFDNFQSALTISAVKASDGGIYICKANNSETEVEKATALIVTQVLPYFVQAPRSYMEIETLTDAYLQLDIEISFKPELANGKHNYIFYLFPALGVCFRSHLLQRTL